MAQDEAGPQLIRLSIQPWLQIWDCKLHTMDEAALEEG